MSEKVNGNSVNGHSVNGKVKTTKCPSHMQYSAVTEIPETLEKDFVYPDLPSRCTWDRNKKDQVTPHTKRSS